MASLFPFFDPFTLLMALGAGLVAGCVKGVVGFGMPMIMISLLAMFLTPDLALAGLILPTLVTNGIQALREGITAAWASVRRFRVFMSVGLVFLLASAQLFRVLPGSTMLLVLGLAVVFFAGIQLLGLRLRLSLENRRAEAGFGAIAGGIGGVSGVWGPPTVMFLTALDTPKSDQMRIQGVIYGLGAVALAAAHVGSGVLRWDTASFSAFLILPAVAGMWLGGKVRDRIDQATFRRVTLLVLLIAGLNLVRRGWIG